MTSISAMGSVELPALPIAPSPDVDRGRQCSGRRLVLDAIVGLFIAFVAVKEGPEAWRGEGCCVAPGVVDGCADGCCSIR